MDNICYSEIIFDIPKSDNCIDCSLDGYYVIKNNQIIFEKFIDLKSDYIKKIFIILKNVIDYEI